MIEDYQVFTFKIDLSDKTLDKKFIDIYEDLSQLIKEETRRMFRDGISYELMADEAKKYIKYNMMRHINLHINDHQGNGIPYCYDESKSVVFSIKRDNFTLDVEVMEGNSKIYMKFWSDCIKIVGTVGNKLLFRNVLLDNEMYSESDETYFIDTNKISYLKKYSKSSNSPFALKI